MLTRSTKLLFLLVFVFTIQGLIGQELDLSQKIPVDPKLKVGKLENGMTYYIRQNEKPENRLELRLAVNTGSVMEDDDQLGLAHFTEHMAFNGTKNFSKNELVDYLQSVGVRFGADLNAYTSFDETVYMLHLPSDSTEIVNQGFQILEDWAHQVTFDDEEIDKERGVVVEEWRLGQGADRRMLDKYLPVIFKDSKYADRLPIGTKEILENFEYETIKKFYRDWYRPELMAVVAVGDMEIEVMEQKILSHFGRIKVSEDARERTNYPIPDHDETLVSIVSDKEAAFTRIILFYKTDAEVSTDLADFRNLLKYRIYTGMINQRLDELRQKADPPYLFASTTYGGLWARTKSAYQSYAVVNETGIPRGLETILEENERVRLHGFTAGELERYKKDMLIGYESAYKERDKTESENYAREYVSHYLEKEPTPGIEFELDFVKKVLPGITANEINELTDKLITPGNRVVVITAPQKEGLVLPTEAEIRQVLKGVEEKEISAYEDVVVASSLLSTMPRRGSVTARRELEEIGVTEFTLSNGIKVQLKPTDFKNDEILFGAYSPGGHSLYPDEDYYSAINTSAVISQSGVAEFSAIDLQKYMAGKIVGVSPYVDDLSEGLRGSCAPQDLETMFQWIHLQFVSPRKDAEIFQSYIAKNRALYKNLLSNPQYFYQDQLARTLSQDHLRGGGFPKDEDWDLVDFERLYEIYQDRFADASDFAFFFVGNFEVDQIKPFLEVYLGSLPRLDRGEKWMDRGVRPPAGVVDKRVEKGSDPKSMVTLIWADEAEYSREELYKMLALTEVLDIKLIEVLREDKSGVYGVGANGNLSQFPYENYRISVRFPCAPENVEDLIAAAFAEIEKIKKDGPTDEDLSKVKETLKRERQENLKQNNYWIGVLRTYYVNGQDPRETLMYEQRIEGINKEDIQKAAVKYANMDKYARVVLFPEAELSGD